MRRVPWSRCLAKGELRAVVCDQMAGASCDKLCSDVAQASQKVRGSRIRTYDLRVMSSTSYWTARIFRVVADSPLKNNASRELLCDEKIVRQ